MLKWDYNNITKTRLFKYIKNFVSKTEIFHIKILGEPVLTSTHNQWFWAEIRKNIVYLVNPSFFVVFFFVYTKVGFKGAKLYSSCIVSEGILSQVPDNF